MNYKMFLAELSRTKGWYLESDGAIRNRSGACPICHLANRFLKKRKFADSKDEVAASQKVLQLETRMLDKIVVATDNEVKDVRYSPRTRRDLLKATGLAL